MDRDTNSVERKDLTTETQISTPSSGPAARRILSPSPTPSSREASPFEPSGSHQLCISSLEDILTQLQHEDLSIRHQCLAMDTRSNATPRSGSRRTSEGTPEPEQVPQPPVRCTNSFETESTSRSTILRNAREFLEKDVVPDVINYIKNVIRIMFCAEHRRNEKHKKYHKALREHWRGDGNQLEVKVLNALRSTFGVKLNPQSTREDRSIEMSPSPSLPSTSVGAGMTGTLSSPSSALDAFEGPDTKLSPSPVSGTATDPGLSSSPRPYRATRPANLTSTRLYYSAPRTQISKTLLVENSKNNEVRDGEVAEDIPFSLRPQRTRSFSNPNLPSQQAHSLTRISEDHYDEDDEINDEILSNENIGDNNEEIENLPNTLTNLEDNLSKSNLSAVHELSALTIRLRQGKYESAQPTIKSSLADRSHFDLKQAPNLPNEALRNSSDDIFQDNPSIPRHPDRDSHHQSLTKEMILSHNDQRPLTKPDGNPFEFVDSELKRVIRKGLLGLGYVYVLRAPKYFEDNDMRPLVKIGYTANTKARLTQLRNGCHIYDLERVRDYLEDGPYLHYKRVEELAHAELGNFQKIFQCSECNTMHTEWFDVPEDVALRVVQRWREWIFQIPYDAAGNLRPLWTNSLADLEIQGRNERDDDHEGRDRRWTEWLQKGISKIE